MSMYERGYRVGLEDSWHPGLSNPCPAIPGSKGYIAWGNGYRAGSKAHTARVEAKARRRMCISIKDLLSYMPLRNSARRNLKAELAAIEDEMIANGDNPT